MKSDKREENIHLMKYRYNSTKNNEEWNQTNERERGNTNSPNEVLYARHCDFKILSSDFLTV